MSRSGVMSGLLRCSLVDFHKSVTFECQPVIFGWNVPSQWADHGAQSLNALFHLAAMVIGPVDRDVKDVRWNRPVGVDQKI